VVEQYHGHKSLSLYGLLPMNDKVNGKTELKYCPHCGAAPVIAQRGKNTSDVCVDCKDCGKFFWVRSHDPDQIHK